MTVVFLSTRFMWSTNPFESLTASLALRSQSQQRRQPAATPRESHNQGSSLLFSSSSSAGVDAASKPSSSSQTVLLLDESVTDPWKRQLFARLDRIREICGELCSINDKKAWEAHVVRQENTSAPLLVNNQTFPRLQVPHINCPAIIASADIDASDTTFPKAIPNELIPLFTVGNMTKYHLHEHFIHSYLGGDAAVTSWTKEELDHQAELGMSNPIKLHGTYRREGTRMVREKLRKLNLSGKSVLVIGTERPWLEALCLGLGAAKITTLEYGRINSSHPKVTALTPSEFRTKYQDGTLGRFDAVASHSSLEHSGLGRYGDALNPWGDILALARAWCVTKPGGLLYLGLPTGQDDIWFNIHRMYGKVRWPLITVNWLQIDGKYHTEQQFEVDHDQDTARRGGSGFLFRKVDV